MHFTGNPSHKEQASLCAYGTDTVVLHGGDSLGDQEVRSLLGCARVWQTRFFSQSGSYNAISQRTEESLGSSHSSPNFRWFCLSQTEQDGHMKLLPPRLI